MRLKETIQTELNAAMAAGNVALVTTLMTELNAVPAPTSVKLAADVFDRFDKQQWVKEDAVWGDAEVLAALPAGSYTVTSKEADGYNGGKRWTAYEAHFLAEKTDAMGNVIATRTLTLPYKSRVIPNKDGELVISNFTAARNWPSKDPNPKITKDQQRVFCVNG